MPRRKGKAGHQRVDFRRNRAMPARQKRWHVPDEHTPHIEDAASTESVRAKGDLSRRRTIVDRAAGLAAGQLREGVVISVCGHFLEVDDGQRIWPCSARQVVRARMIGGRNAIVVGDRVSMRVVADQDGQVVEGVIEQLHPRKTTLTRADAKRTHVIAANIDQVLIVSSIREPLLKPHLIDRYLVAAHAGHLSAIICVNKLDLDEDNEANAVLERYRSIGYRVVGTSPVNGSGIDELRSLLQGKATLLAGQSGVGKSTLLNAVQPSLQLRTATVSESSQKGRHTTTTAIWLKLEAGGAVVDTPGIRALDVAMVPLHELEMHFVEFVPRVAQCRFTNCLHVKEDGCAIKAAVEAGEIDPSRYDSYVEMAYELSDFRSKRFE